MQNDPSRASVRSFSLTRRIIAAIVACQLVLTAGLVLVVILYGRAELERAFDAALDGRATSTLAAVRYTETQPHVLLWDAAMVPASSNPEHRDLFEILASDGHVIARSNGWQGLATKAEEARGRYYDFHIDGVPYRAVALRDVPILDDEGDPDAPPARVTVVYAASLGGLRERLAGLVAYIGVAGLLLLLAANAFAAWTIRRGLGPLRELAAQADAISVHNWEFRTPPGAALANELSPLVRAIETVLGRLRASFRQQREFTSDVAHELKTSVAILKSTVQSLLQRPRAEQEYREGLERLLGDCSRLEDLLARMLRLARIEQLAENGMPRKLATTELTSTCEAALSRIRALADERNVALEFGSPEAVRLRADPEDLELIWLNLVENAVQYSPAGSKVEMRVHRKHPSLAEVSVIDGGPGIPPRELPHIFERFHRGDPSRARSTGGFGLGLAICKALVDAYGGTIEAFSSPGRGTEVRVQLPAEPN